jgi:hypothetical protein
VLAKALVILVVSLLMMCCSIPTKRVVVTDDFHAAAECYYLSPQEKAKLEKRALKGDLRAAKRLAAYHEGYSGDEKEHRRWSAVVARIKGNNGSR